MRKPALDRLSCKFMEELLTLRANLAQQEEALKRKDQNIAMILAKMSVKDIEIVKLKNKLSALESQLAELLGK